MKKTALLLLSLSLCYADFDTNFKQEIKKLAGIDTQIVSKNKLESFKNSYFVIAKTPSGRNFPVIVDEGGKYFIGLNNVANFSQKDSNLIQQELQKASQENKDIQDKALNEAFKQFKSSDFLFLEGSKKNLPTKIVVTDPECPYCRKHLDNIEEELKSANLKLIFAPIPSHGEIALIKSQIIMNQAPKLKSTKEKVKLLREYYRDMKLSATELKTDYKPVESIRNRVFDTELVEAVPLVFEER